MKLSDVGEAELLARILTHNTETAGVTVGPGDDCALVEGPRRGKLVLLKTDCVVEGIHFTAAAAPAAIGWKAMARPLSDIAAMSGVPRFALITLIVSPATSVAWVDALYRGLRKAAVAYDVAIVGGETSSTRGPATVVVALTGEVESARCVRRSGGTAGDILFVTGRLGGSLRGRHLRFRPRIFEARWLTENFQLSAMLDLSDGLAADLPRLAAASGVGYELQPEALPKTRGSSVESAMSDGEDYELLFTVRPKIADILSARWRARWPLKLTRIGHLTVRVPQKNDAAPGFDHFKKR